MWGGNGGGRLRGAELVKESINLSGIVRASLNIPNVNSFETRPKSKFYNLLIYAGYPNKK